MLVNGALKFIFIKKIEGRMMFLFSRTNKQLILVVLSILHCALTTSRNLLVKVICSFYLQFACFAIQDVCNKLIFFRQNINFTDQFYAPPVVIVTAKSINNDSRLSGCNAITTCVEVKLFYKLADSKRLI